jgi:Holliday junction resolvase
MNNVKIIKASGEITNFNVNKFKKSLEKAGANDKLINEITSEIEKILYNNISTNEIYKKAFYLLKRKSRIIAAKYKLKEALFELGPSGYPFEKLIAQLLTFQGFETKTNVIVKGNCVNHEIDVIAIKENKHYLVECKFHSKRGIKSDVKIPLYIQSRFKDVEKNWHKLPGHQFLFHQAWIATNTKFTKDAISYANCMNIHLLGWDYPKKGNIKERIEISGLYPITTLTSLTNEEKKLLISIGIIFCKDICDNIEILAKLFLSKIRKNRILTEAKALCRTN